MNPIIWVHGAWLICLLTNLNTEMEPNFPSMDPYAHYGICSGFIMVRQNKEEHSFSPFFLIPFVYILMGS